MATTGHVAAVAPLVVANRTSRLETTHDRHLNVHEDEVERGPGHEIECARAVRHRRHLVPAFLQHTNRELLVDGVVLGEEHAKLRADSARGASATKRRLQSIGAERFGERVPQIDREYRLVDRRRDAELGGVRTDELKTARVLEQHELPS